MLMNKNEEKKLSNFANKSFSKKVDNNSKFENVAKKIIKRYHETFEELAK